MHKRPRYVCMYVYMHIDEIFVEIESRNINITCWCGYWGSVIVHCGASRWYTNEEECQPHIFRFYCSLKMTVMLNFDIIEYNSIYFIKLYTLCHGNITIGRIFDNKFKIVNNSNLYLICLYVCGFKKYILVFLKLLTLI